MKTSASVLLRNWLEHLPRPQSLLKDALSVTTLAAELLRV